MSRSNVCFNIAWKIFLLLRVLAYLLTVSTNVPYIFHVDNARKHLLSWRALKNPAASDLPLPYIYGILPFLLKNNIDD